jgi:hypothetical protein
VSKHFGLARLKCERKGRLVTLIQQPETFDQGIHERSECAEGYNGGWKTVTKVADGDRGELSDHEDHYELLRSGFAVFMVAEAKGNVGPQ